MTCDVCGMEFGDLAPPGTFRHSNPLDCVSHLRELLSAAELSLLRSDEATQAAKGAAAWLLGRLRELNDVAAVRAAESSWKWLKIASCDELAAEKAARVLRREQHQQDFASGLLDRQQDNA